MKKKVLFFFIILTLFTKNIFSQTSDSSEPEPYNTKAFPQWAIDLRDAEIITIGSLPFVMLGVTLTYSFINVAEHNFDFAYFSNPFAKGDSFSQEQQKNIIITSAIVCAGIGITNFTINLIKRGIDKKNSIQSLQSNIQITQINDELKIIPIPEKYKREKKYLYGNIESAVF